VITIYNNGILLPSNSRLLLDKKGNINIEITNLIFGIFRQFILFTQIEKITYQQNENSKEIIFLVKEFTPEKLNQIPKKLRFICLHIKNDEKYFIFQDLTKGLELFTILKEIAKSNKNNSQ